MMAVFVTTAVAEDGPAPTAASESASACVELLAGRDDLLRRGLALDQLGQPGRAAGAVPEEALGAGEEVRRQPAQPELGAELEERVGLEPGLLGRAVLAGAHGPDDPVERGPDDVEVGGRPGVLPLLREDPLGEVERLVGLRLDCVLGCDRTALGRGGQVLAEGRDELVDPADGLRRRAWRARSRGPRTPVRHRRGR